MFCSVLFLNVFNNRFVKSLDAADSKVENEHIEVSCDNLPPPIPPHLSTKRNRLDRKPLKRTLKNCDKAAEV